MDSLRTRDKAVGIKECRKIVKKGGAVCAYVATDAAPNVTEPFTALCREHGVPVKDAESMEALGKACGIDVGAAVAIIKKEEGGENECQPLTS